MEKVNSNIFFKSLRVFLALSLAFSLNVFNKTYSWADQSEDDEEITLQAGTFDESSVIVKFKDGVQDEEEASILSENDAVKDDISANAKNIGDNTIKVDLEQGKSVAQAINELESDSRVEYAEPNYVATLFDDDTTLSTTSVNDPYQSQQWYLNDTNAKVKDAWDTVKCNQSVTVAFLDSGIDSDHPDLVNNLVGGRSFVGGDATNFEDTLGHGTMVAGIIAAQSNNGIGISGISYNAKLFALKAFENATGNSATMATAINWLVANNSAYGVKVINISAGLSPGTESKTLKEAITKAYNAGILCVCASGNDGNTGKVRFPASMNITVAVGSIDSTHTRASSSNGGSALDVVAPGVGIYSTYKNGIYYSNNGTSFASPFVAGVAALCLASNSSLTPASVKSCLTSTAKHLGSAGKNNEYGYGQVVASDAVQEVSKNAMYRLYNPYTGEHFYTASLSEKTKLTALGWNDEGIGWWNPKSGGVAVYRLYNKYAGDHHYTTSASEYAFLKSAGWTQEGVGWQSAKNTVSGAKAVLRQYNPFALVGTHNFTTSTSERDKLVSLGWKNEGTAWWGL